MGAVNVLQEKVLGRGASWEVVKTPPPPARAGHTPPSKHQHKGLEDTVGPSTVWALRNRAPSPATQQARPWAPRAGHLTLHSPRGKGFHHNTATQLLESPKEGGVLGATWAESVC